MIHAGKVLATNSIEGLRGIQNSYKARKLERRWMVMMMVMTAGSLSTL
jgi:hypothetical protein